jgi:hypothetical protein
MVTHYIKKKSCLLHKAQPDFKSKYSLISLYVVLDGEKCKLNIHCIIIVNFPFTRNRINLQKYLERKAGSYV